MSYIMVSKVDLFLHNDRLGSICKYPNAVKIESFTKSEQISELVFSKNWFNGFLGFFWIDIKFRNFWITLRTDENWHVNIFQIALL